jgi:hypothetical protein
MMERETIPLSRSLLILLQIVILVQDFFSDQVFNGILSGEDSNDSVWILSAIRDKNHIVHPLPEHIQNTQAIRT